MRILLVEDDSSTAKSIEMMLKSEGYVVDLADMGMVESIHLCAFHWVLNDVFARINAEGRYART